LCTTYIMLTSGWSMTVFLVVSHSFGLVASPVREWRISSSLLALPVLVEPTRFVGCAAVESVTSPVGSALLPEGGHHLFGVGVQLILVDGVFFVVG
jgi:hypothetical protein